MQELQMKFQKALLTGCLILAGAMVFYALGFSTNLYALSYHSNPESTLFYVPGAELYPAVQPFNRAFFMNTIWLFIACVAMFLTLTHRRRLYYASNAITSVVFAGGCAYIGGDLLSHALEYRVAYLQVDFERLKEVTEMMKLEYAKSTFMLDLGVVMSVLLFVAAAALVVNLALKAAWMKREHWLKPTEEEAGP